jgi:hypothetical protein
VRGASFEVPAEERTMGSITLNGPMFLYRSFALLADTVDPLEFTGLQTVTPCRQACTAPRIGECQPSISCL